MTAKSLSKNINVRSYLPLKILALIDDFTSQHLNQFHVDQRADVPSASGLKNSIKSSKTHLFTDKCFLINRGWLPPPSLTSGASTTVETPLPPSAR